MPQRKIRFFTGLLSIATLLAFLVFSDNVKGKLFEFCSSSPPKCAILLSYLAIPIFFVWISLGIPAGTIATAVICAVLIFLFANNIYIIPILSLLVASLLGYRLSRRFEDKAKTVEVEREKVEEDINLLEAEIKALKKDNFRMKNTLDRIVHLEKILEEFSHTVYEEDTLNAIVNNTFNLFKDANRALLYLVDEEAQDIYLVGSRKRNMPAAAKAKKGQAFEHLVMKQRTPLLVEDAETDFRFSYESSPENFNSLIEAPLTTENKITGMLRIDSLEKQKLNQTDLRFLGIIADLSSVALRNAKLYKEVEELAIHDGLTGLYVHKYFTERLETEITRSIRNNMPISLLMLDLDHFKKYNDKYGHSAGDLVLRQIVEILETFTKPGDIVSRYGGEEFTILLLNKDKEKATEVAEEIRKKINDTPIILRRQETKMSVSIGVASCPSEAKTPEEFMQLADSRLYKAKEKGRNNVWAK